MNTLDGNTPVVWGNVTARDPKRLPVHHVEVKPYGTGPRARFPYGIRRDPVSGTLEDQLRASVEMMERERLLAALHHLGSQLAGYVSRHPEAQLSSDLLDQAADALEDAK